MKKFLVTYYNAARKTENSVAVRGRSLEEVRAGEERIVKQMNEINPFITLKSVIEVAA